MSKSLRVLIVGIVAAAIVYGAALTLALTGHLGSAPAIVVLVLGAILFPTAWVFVRRRLWTPFTALERGIQRVSEGDLSTQVPVLRNDELGTVASHFNQMTRVLRDRAEEQGREHQAQAREEEGRQIREAEPDDEPVAAPDDRENDVGRELPAAQGGHGGAW